MLCVSKEAFYKELETYKQNQKRNSSQTTLFIEDKFYDSAKEFVKSQAENALTESNTVNQNSYDKINKVASNNTQEEEMVVPSKENLTSLHFRHPSFSGDNGCALSCQICLVESSIWNGSADLSWRDSPCHK